MDCGLPLHPDQAWAAANFTPDPTVLGGRALDLQELEYAQGAYAHLLDMASRTVTLDYWLAEQPDRDPAIYRALTAEMAKDTRTLLLQFGVSLLAIDPSLHAQRALPH